MEDDPLYSSSLPQFQSMGRCGLKGSKLTSMPNQNRTTAMPMQEYVDNHSNNNNNRNNVLPTLSSSPLLYKNKSSTRPKKHKSDGKKQELINSNRK